MLRLARSLVTRSNLTDRDALIEAYPEGIVQVKAGRKPYILIWNPSLLEHVLVANQDNYVKSAQYRVLATVLGKGLLTNEGDSWSRQRRLIQPMFARRHLGQFASNMTAGITAFADEWSLLPDDSDVDAAKAMNRLTLDVVGRALFGTELADQAARLGRAVTSGVRAGVVAARLQLVFAQFAPPQWVVDRAPALLRRVPPVTRGIRRLRDVVVTTDEVVSDIIARREASLDADPGDLLGLLLAARDEDGRPMSRRQVRDELMTFLLAGHETTANGLAWMWYLLARHSAARERLLAEVDSVLEGRVPTAADADRLVWTSAVFQETLRLYPPAWVFTRQAVVGDVVGGFRVPAGSTVIVPTYFVHRFPSVWSDPSSFDPSRFLPGASHPRLAHIPFGAGRRICVGAGFAVMEATLITAMLAQRFTLDLEASTRVVPEPAITLGPRHGIPMILRKR